ncbi:ROK family protein [Pedobacter hartonius]|uniref:Sugar kinase of the NBD/HSP70 family, may contain an N-terminal HTH domain n=1 Tax=Pedobacter hartonius TaxID=425514 RepID=A0A1H4FGR3_9SPHI|nr:ROK family protein [Pedobacter hartonius]SEA96486.1 Sugar kinase of the NBD/HSP70 family, may contain an N-terminal HTH domain [Pedobacter hartonius]
MSLNKIKVLIANSETIKCLYYNKLLTSADVSNQIVKSIPYAIKVLNDLKKNGYVEEMGLASSSGGRKPLNYSLISDSFYLVSVAMDQFSARMVVVDMNNNFVTDIIRYEFDIFNLKPDQLVGYINQFIEGSKISKSAILGIGLTMPGFIDTEMGINYTYMNTAGQPLAAYLQQQISIPVFLDNDSTAIALAEQKFGVAAPMKNVMVLNLGWGIGLGMILNNKIFRGNNGLAGEFSHIPLFKNGKLCNCGKRGCLETEASLIAVTAIAKEGISNGQTTSLSGYADVDADAIINEAIKGDVFSVKLISEAAYHVGEGLAILIHLMNPGAIVLSGKGSVVGKLWLSPIQQAINEHCIPLLINFTEIKVSNLNTKAQLIGGAALIVENFGKALGDKLNAIEMGSLEKAG